MIEVGPAGVRSVAREPWLVCGHDVDQRIPGAKLRQFPLPLFEAQAEDIEIEPLELCGIGRTQHDMIDPDNVEGCWHIRFPFNTHAILIADGAEPLAVRGHGSAAMKLGNGVLRTDRPNRPSTRRLKRVSGLPKVSIR